MLKVSRDKPRASPATPKKLHYYRRTQHDSARPVAPGSCCDARTKASKKKPCSLGTGVGPSHHKAHQQQHGGTKGIKCRGDHYHKHAAASVEIEAAAQQHQIFNAISQTSPALFTVPFFLPAISKGPLYATMNVFGFGSVSVQKKYFLGNVCLKNSGLITRQNDLPTKPEAYVLHN